VQRETRKAMIVCSDSGNALKAYLDCEGWRVIWAYDGPTAIAKVRRERFDLAVLISTGPEMDITETLFNVRDIRQSMPIAIVQRRSDLDDTQSRAAYLPADNNLIAVQGLDGLVRLLRAYESSVGGQSSRDRPQP
jgi:DNA-binding response OmpR family regulator